MASNSSHWHPTVLFPLTLPTLLKHILATQSTTTSPTTLIVCLARDVFLQALQNALQQEEESAELGSLRQSVTPTLHTLSTARHVKLAFCSSVQSLLAYLTAYRGFDASMRSGGAKDGTGTERLVLVNLLSLHAPTPSFSAQGLSRTFASAVETMLRLDARLWMVECEGMGTRTWDHFDLDGEDEMMREEMESHEEEAQPTTQGEDPWEQEVPILNVSARRYGSGSGDRAWAGRTVKIKRIAGRWFHFEKLMAE